MHPVCALIDGLVDDAGPEVVIARRPPQSRYARLLVAALGFGVIRFHLSGEHVARRYLLILPFELIEPCGRRRARRVRHALDEVHAVPTDTVLPGELPDTGAGGLAAGASLLIGNAAVGLVMLLGAGYAVIRRR